MVEFDTLARERLGYYVYALFDSGKPSIPFYVGKGQGNRVFDHARGKLIQQDEDEPLSPKLELIAEIKANVHTGRHVIHKIVRFGLSEDEAFKVEAAVIDIVNYMHPDTLLNQISGQGIAEGFYNATDLALSLSADELQVDRPMLIIKIERKWTELLKEWDSGVQVPPNEIFTAVRGHWKLNISRANQAECVLAVARGLVRGVFVPIGWKDAGFENRKEMIDVSTTYNFDHLIGKSVAHLFERGTQNPIRYLRC